MKNSVKDIVKKMVAVALLAGILFTIPQGGEGELGIMPLGDVEQEYNQYS